jgi:hypothetical protein
MGSKNRLTAAIVFTLGLCFRTVTAQNSSSTATTTQFLANPNQGTNFCFGQGAICLADDDIETKCSLEGEAHGTTASNACLCTEGGVAIKQA